MVKRKVQKRKTVRKAPNRQTVSTNKKAYWTAYRNLQAQVRKAWNRLKSDVQRKAYAKAQADQRQLLLLMGECDYMLKECIRLKEQRISR